METRYLRTENIIFTLYGGIASLAMFTSIYMAANTFPCMFSLNSFFRVFNKDIFFLCAHLFPQFVHVIMLSLTTSIFSWMQYIRSYYFFSMILSRNIILCNIIFGLCETRTVLLYGIIKVCIWKQIDFSRASYVVFRLFIIAFVHYIQSILWVSLFSILVQFYLKLVSIWRYLFS